MPRVRSRTARARRGLTEAERRDLFGGDAGAFPTAAARRAAWRAYGADLMAEYAARRPGEAPAAFWQYDGPPELRTVPPADVRVLADDELMHRNFLAGEAFRAERAAYLLNRRRTVRSD